MLPPIKNKLNKMQQLSDILKTEYERCYRQVEELVEKVHPSRRSLLQRGLVCHQGEFSIVSVTASVQVLADGA